MRSRRCPVVDSWLDSVVEVYYFFLNQHNKKNIFNWIWNKKRKRVYFYLFYSTGNKKRVLLKFKFYCDNNKNALDAIELFLLDLIGSPKHMLDLDKLGIAYGRLTTACVVALLLRATTVVEQAFSASTAAELHRAHVGNYVGLLALVARLLLVNLRCCAWTRRPAGFKPWFLIFFNFCFSDNNCGRLFFNYWTYFSAYQKSLKWAKIFPQLSLFWLFINFCTNLIWKTFGMTYFALIMSSRSFGGTHAVVLKDRSI